MSTLVLPEAPHPIDGSVRDSIVKRGAVPIHLRWQTWHDSWRRSTRHLRWYGACLGCGRNTFAFTDGENDPRGPIGDNTLDEIPLPADDHLPDYLPPAEGGQRKIRCCALCANDQDSYLHIRATATALVAEHGPGHVAAITWPGENPRTEEDDQ